MYKLDTNYISYNLKVGFVYNYLKFFQIEIKEVI